MKLLHILKATFVAGLLGFGVLVALYYAIGDVAEKTERYAVVEQLKKVSAYVTDQESEFVTKAVKWGGKPELDKILLKNTRKNRNKILRSDNFKKDDIDFIALIDINKKIRLSRSFDADKARFSKLNQKIKYQLSTKKFTDLLAGENLVSGMIASDSLFLVAIVPVFAYEEPEDLSGYLVLGRELPTEKIISDNIIQVEISEVNLALNPHQARMLEQFRVMDFIHLKNQHELKSSYLLNSITSEPLVIVYVVRPVQRLSELIKISWLSILIIVLIGMMLGYTYWWGKKNKLYRDLQRLSADIQSIRVGTELSGRISNDNRHIFEPIVNAINQKIGGFEKSFDTMHSANRQHDAEIVLNELPLEAFLKDIDLKYIMVNQKYCDSLGIVSEEIVGKTDEELSISDNSEIISEKENEVIETKEPLVFEEIIENNIRGKSFYLTHLIPFINAKGIVEGVVGVKIDISDHKRAEAEMEMAIKVLENTAEGVMVTDAESRIVHVNSAYSELTGYREEELLGKIPLLLQTESRSKIYQGIQKSLQTTGVWKGELWSSRKNGTNYPEMINIKAIKNKEGIITNYFSMSNDITEQKKWEDQLYKMAHYDALTSLPNRTLFKDRLKQEIIRAQRSGKNFGILFLDLDLFKSINDSLGHAAGDKLLKIVADRLKETLRNADSIARLGGDEFTIMVTDLISDYQKNIGYLTRLSEKIIEVIQQPMEIDGREINATCSIGVTVFPVDADNDEDLLRNADSAMYYAKSQGRRNYQFYSKEFNEQAVERLEKEIEFRAALKAGALEVYFQPQVDVISRHVVGAEALLRWKKDGENVLGPERIIALAEETGLIYELGNWILKTACVECKKWVALGHKNIRVAVNLSTRQFRQKNLVEIVTDILNETGLPAKLLELEVTESALMENIEYSIEMMADLSRLGVRWSLDDFGTGYSSLTYLRDFPVHVLKVDQSFVREITINPEDSAIVETIIDLAHRLHLTVIAEGVENEEQLKVLSRMNCEQIQGYYFSRPMSPVDFIEYVSKGVRV